MRCKSFIDKYNIVLQCVEITTEVSLNVNLSQKFFFFNFLKYIMHLCSD